MRDRARIIPTTAAHPSFINKNNSVQLRAYYRPVDPRLSILLPPSSLMLPLPGEALIRNIRQRVLRAMHRRASRDA